MIHHVRHGSDSVKPRYNLKSCLGTLLGSDTAYCTGRRGKKEKLLLNSAVELDAAASCGLRKRLLSLLSVAGSETPVLPIRISLHGITDELPPYHVQLH